MSNAIPDDILNIIFYFIPYKDKINYHQVCKAFNTNYKNLLLSTLKIQHFYRCRKLPDMYLNVGDKCLDFSRQEYIDEEYDLYYNINQPYNWVINYDEWTPKLVYRFYIAKYPEELLETYINFFCSTRIRPRGVSSDRTLWIENNKERKKNRKYLWDYFNENQISVQEIMEYGW